MGWRCCACSKPPSVSFRDCFSFGALVCFLVTVADVPIWRIGAPFWGLALGLAAAWLLERDDLKRAKS